MWAPIRNSPASVGTFAALQPKICAADQANLQARNWQGTARLAPLKERFASVASSRHGGLRVGMGIDSPSRHSVFFFFQREHGEVGGDQCTDAQAGG